MTDKNFAYGILAVALIALVLGIFFQLNPTPSEVNITNEGGGGGSGLQRISEIAVFMNTAEDAPTPVPPEEGSGSFDFTTNTLTPPAGWVLFPDTPSSDQQTWATRTILDLSLIHI